MLTPVRHSDLCIVYQYERHPSLLPSYIEDKAFQSSGIVLTTSGRWDYYGKSAAGTISSGIAVSAVFGRRFGCRHDPLTPDRNIIVALQPGALDDDQPVPFGREIVRFDAEPVVRFALNNAHVENFESCIFELLDAYAKASDGPNEKAHGYLRMQRVKRFIEQHAMEEIALAELGRLVCISPFSLLRQFKAHTGLTPHDYMMNLRLRCACRLLSKYGLSIGNVSKIVGFKDQRYFSRWFLKATGVSPSTYRGCTPSP